ncbi:MAG TPA: DNA-processing protein DprA [Patescibacteria group bacterium]|nr:DNA-processing protein DprA [Patescibacteria group bacterium]
MKYLHALNKIPGVGTQKMKMLFNFFPTAKDIWEAEPGSLMTSGIGPKLSEKMILERDNINPDEEWDFLERENIKIITLTDENYPTLLREIHHPPYILYTKGNLDLNSAPLISIVGSRKYTEYGKLATLSFARDLSRAGFVIVSGMALGIDSFAHRGTLDARGKTVAVLGNSLDDSSIYPVNNFNLSREILNSGVLISEYPPIMKAGKLTFPARNRIIAGLSRGTLVIEAGESSGALLTAKMALESNREVFSVPGQIFSPQSFGTNNLIRCGARLTGSVNDILEELELFLSHRQQPPKPKNTNTEEKIILSVLTYEPLQIDNIRKLTKLSMATVSSTLSVMEIKGWVKNIGGQNYILL